MHFENEEHDFYTYFELRCQKLPERSLSNVFRSHCSLEHQVVATPCTLPNLAKITFVGALAHRHM